MRYYATTPTKVSSEQSLSPAVYLWNPFIKSEQSRDTAEGHNPQEEEDQLPRGDAQVGAIESPEVQPCTDVDEASAVKH